MHLLIAVTVLWAGTALRAAAPPNDRFADRLLLIGTDISVTGSSPNATKEGGEPDHADNNGGKSVWWTWTAPASGEVWINTDGSNFDTLLGVYTGTNLVTALSAVASNDDRGVHVTSRVKFNTAANVSYHLAVDGYNDGAQTNSGDVVLNLVFFSDPIPRPANDSFADRVARSGLPVTDRCANPWASREVGEPDHGELGGDTSVWWTWTAPASTWVRVSTLGSTFDTMLAVYQGTALSSLNLVAANDDIDLLAGVLTSALVFQAGAGGTYQIAVDGYDGAYGDVALTLEEQTVRLEDPRLLPNIGLRFTVNGAAGATYDIRASTDLLQWNDVGSVQAVGGGALFTDPSATNLATRFYQAVQR